MSNTVKTIESMPPRIKFSTPVIADFFEKYCLSKCRSRIGLFRRNAGKVTNVYRKHKAGRHFYLLTRFWSPVITGFIVLIISCTFFQIFRNIYDEMTFSSAVFSGMCASFASLFGKLLWSEFNETLDIRLKYTMKIFCLCIMVLLNSMVWTFFVKALQSSKTVEATAVSTATNYILSGVLGYIAFGEVTGPLWWFGISLVTLGVVVITGSNRTNNNSEDLKLFKKPALNSSKMKKWAEIIEKKLLPPKPELSKVLSGLYVGNYRDSKDSTQLERHGITHIIAIHDAARKLHHDKHYLCVMASDTPDQNLSQYFSICNDFIHAARLRGGNVLIHCLAGMSRSVTVAVAYIMSVTDLSWKEALKVVRVGRSVANPNLGFQKQLQEFETCRLAEERKRLKERYPSLALIESDQEQCRISLLSYQSLLLSKDICEGNCPAGEICPTGLCRSPTTKRLIRRKSSSTSLRTSQSPRMLPPTPKAVGGADLTRSNVSINTCSPTLGRRPGDGPPGFHPQTRPSYSFTSSHSRMDVTELPPGMAMEDLRKRKGNSAPGTPMVTPPVSPQHWPRRASTITKKTSNAQKPPFRN